MVPKLVWVLIQDFLQHIFHYLPINPDLIEVWKETTAFCPDVSKFGNIVGEYDVSL